ncbi:MAG: hypothetical protein P4M15_10065 [Alphaproteobacteria bacterium]|nr:hypothetical protein [Alphaproteobacteria bacterium]
MKLYHASPYDIEHIEPHPSPPLGNVIYAQPDKILAHAYALKTPAVFMAGTVQNWRFMVAHAADEAAWRNQLAEKDGVRGGFIYEVDPGAFTIETTPFGNECVARVPVAILARTFVTPEEAMKQGVQIFISHSLAPFSEAWDRKMAGLLIENFLKGDIEWVNYTHVINPTLPPRLKNPPPAHPESSMPQGPS